MARSYPKKIRKGFYLSHGVCFVTWAASRIDDVGYFSKALKELLPAGTKYFGCKEYHQDGRPHYHALIRFPEYVAWHDATRHFMMELPDGQIDTKAIRIQVPLAEGTMQDFIMRHETYCQKEVADGELFGEKFDLFAEIKCCGCGVTMEIGTRACCLPCLERIWVSRVSEVGPKRCMIALMVVSGSDFWKVVGNGMRRRWIGRSAERGNY